MVDELAFDHLLHHATVPEDVDRPPLATEIQQSGTDLLDEREIINLLETVLKESPLRQAVPAGLTVVHAHELLKGAGIRTQLAAQGLLHVGIHDDSVALDHHPIPDHDHDHDHSHEVVVRDEDMSVSSSAGALLLAGVGD